MLPVLHGFHNEVNSEISVNTSNAGVEGNMPIISKTIALVGDADFLVGCPAKSK